MFCVDTAYNECAILLQEIGNGKLMGNITRKIIETYNWVDCRYDMIYTAFGVPNHY